jgi:hypothetical protein
MICSWTLSWRLTSISSSSCRSSARRWASSRCLLNSAPRACWTARPLNASHRPIISTIIPAAQVISTSSRFLRRRCGYQAGRNSSSRTAHPPAGRCDSGGGAVGTRGRLHRVVQVDDLGLGRDRNRAILTQR